MVSTMTVENLLMVVSFIASIIAICSFAKYLWNKFVKNLAKEIVEEIDKYPSNE